MAKVKSKQCMIDTHSPFYLFFLFFSSFWQGTLAHIHASRKLFGDLLVPFSLQISFYLCSSAFFSSWKGSEIKVEWERKKMIWFLLNVTDWADLGYRSSSSSTRFIDSNVSFCFRLLFFFPPNEWAFTNHFPQLDLVLLFFVYFFAVIQSKDDDLLYQYAVKNKGYLIYFLQIEKNDSACRMLVPYEHNNWTSIF